MSRMTPWMVALVVCGVSFVTGCGTPPPPPSDAAVGDVASDTTGPECTDAGEMRCGAACVDSTSDSNNCGRCGNVCPSGQTCAASACMPPADPCAAITECTRCASTAGCGWCATAFRCQAGSSSGPSSGTCGQWYGNPFQC